MHVFLVITYLRSNFPLQFHFIEKSFTKRSALPVNRLYRKLREKKSVRPNGYLTCKNARDRNHAVFNCLIKGKTPPVGCKPFPTMRRYVLV